AHAVSLAGVTAVARDTACAKRDRRVRETLPRVQNGHSFKIIAVSPVRSITSPMMHVAAALLARALATKASALSAALLISIPPEVWASKNTSRRTGAGLPSWRGPAATYDAFVALARVRYGLRASASAPGKIGNADRERTSVVLLP